MASGDYRTFLWLCVREAFPSWGKGESLLTNLIPQIPGIVALLFGVGGALISWILLPTLGAALWTLAAILLVLVAPFRVWQRQQSDLMDLEQALARIKDERAELEVEVVNTDKGSMLLEVTNRGELASLTAQIRIVEGIELVSNESGLTLPTYVGAWEQAEGNLADLHQGLSDNLIIGFRNSMLFWNVYKKGRFPYTVSGPAKLVITVTISCAPKMLAGPFIRTYVVEDGKLHTYEAESDEE